MTIDNTLQIKTSSFVFEEKRGRPKTDNPFIEHVKESWDEREDGSKLGVTKEVTVKNDRSMSTSGEPKNVVFIRGQLRDAAAQLGLGVRVATSPATKAGKPVSDPTGGTHTTIFFAAKERTLRPRRETV